MGAAGHRAAHQVLEAGRVLRDPLAVRILGEDAASLIDGNRSPECLGIRHFVVARSRVAEDALDLAFAAGVRQLVILGAGLDTYAFRSPYADRLRMFEVDHPSTQAFKRDRLAAASIRVPSTLTFVPVVLGQEPLAVALRSARFDPAAQTFFMWLGVTPYLPKDLVLETLEVLARHSGGADVVFDYANPTESLRDPLRRAAQEALLARVAEQGEPFLSFFDTEELHRALRRMEFVTIEDLGPTEIVTRYYPPPASAHLGGDPDHGGHICLARTLPPCGARDATLG